MRRSTAVIFAALAMFAMAAPTFAQTKTPAPSAQAKPQTPKPKDAWANGRIEKVDQAAKTIVIKQGNRDMTFALAADVQVTQGKKTLQVGDLASNVGRDVKLRYTTNAGTRTASVVQVSESAPAKGKTPARK